MYFLISKSVKLHFELSNYYLGHELTKNCLKLHTESLNLRHIKLKIEALIYFWTILCFMVFLLFDFFNRSECVPLRDGATWGSEHVAPVT